MRGRIGPWLSPLHDVATLRWAVTAAVAGLFFLVAGVSAECAGGGEFAELVAYHVFCNVHGNKLVAVVYGESVAYELGSDHGCATPRLNDVLLAAGVHVGDFFLQLYGDKGSFF